MDATESDPRDTSETLDTGNFAEASITPSAEDVNNETQSAQLKNTIGLSEAPTEQQNKNRVERTLERWQVGEKWASELAKYLPSGLDTADVLTATKADDREIFYDIVNIEQTNKETSGGTVTGAQNPDASRLPETSNQRIAQSATESNDALKKVQGFRCMRARAHLWSR